MTIIIPQSEGYTRQETWEPTDLYCPNCGKQAVWDCPDSVDWDGGETNHLCTFCEFGGYGIEWSPLNKEDWYVVQRILDPTLSQPKHNPRPIPEHIKCFMKTMFVNLGKKPPLMRGKTVTFMKYEPMKSLDGGSGHD